MKYDDDGDYGNDSNNGENHNYENIHNSIPSIKFLLS